MDTVSLKKAFHALERAYQEGDCETYLAGHDLGSGDVRVFLPDFGAPLGKDELPEFIAFATSLPGAGWILPRDVRCCCHGDIGIVTYVFPTDGHELGRGTRVFRWREGQWRCIHTHLSTAPDVPPPVSTTEGA